MALGLCTDYGQGYLVFTSFLGPLWLSNCMVRIITFHRQKSHLNCKAVATGYTILRTVEDVSVYDRSPA